MVDERCDSIYDVQPINGLSDASSLPTDQVGPYRLDDRLGQGGMGLVYRGVDTRSDTPVAIKYVAAWSDEDHLRRLRREARTISRLEHPAIVRLVDVIEYDGVWLVMELIDGTTVSSMIAGQQPLDTEAAVDIARHVALGLMEAHDKDVLHRDLKSENVMVTPQGEVKLLDFGLAKLLQGGDDSGTLTEPGEVMGTCRAMSPEQARGQHLDGRSDLFALGVLLYEMTTGESPFETSTPLATMKRVCEHEPLPARVRNPKVPEGVSDLIETLLAKRREERPQNAASVVGRLEGVAKGQVHSDTAAPQSWTHDRRTKTLALVALVATFLVTGGLWLARAPHQDGASADIERSRGVADRGVPDFGDPDLGGPALEALADGAWQDALSAADALSDGDLERARAGARLLTSSQPPAAVEVFAHRLMARADIEAGFLPSAERWLEISLQIARQHGVSEVDALLDLAHLRVLEDDVGAARQLMAQAGIDDIDDDAAVEVYLDTRISQPSGLTDGSVRLALPPCLPDTEDAIRDAEARRDIETLERIMHATRSRDLMRLHLRARLAKARLIDDDAERADVEATCRERGFVRLARLAKR